MSLVNLNVMYGHLEGAGGDFARDPTGHLSIEAGIFEKHGLNVSWNHVQGTEERYRRLENGSAQISLVVGRASLQHFLTSRTTRILGCAMNSCPYYLVAAPTITKLADLKNKTVACREGPSRNTPIAETFRNLAQLECRQESHITNAQRRPRRFQFADRWQSRRRIPTTAFRVYRRREGIQSHFRVAGCGR